MLEIHERTDITGYENIVSGIESDCIHIVESINGSEVNGYGVYSVGEEGIAVHDFSSEEWEITDGIIRTILFKGMLGGINRCDFAVPDSEKQQKLLRLGFIKDDTTSIEDINSFMCSCQNCKQSQ
ncbi:MAG: hypothetical protein ACI4JB_07885 [Porcipelethomonas sp.]